MFRCHTARGWLLRKAEKTETQGSENGLAGGVCLSPTHREHSGGEGKEWETADIKEGYPDMHGEMDAQGHCP